MKLGSSIFLWVFPAAVIPLALLVLAATSYSEYLDNQRVNQEVSDSLTTLATELKQRLLIEHDLVQGLANIPAVQAFVPVLADLYEEKEIPDFMQKIDKTSQALETFQSVRRSLGIIRILDPSGNTLIKVRSGRRVDTALEAFGEVAYVEDAPHDNSLIPYLQDLNPGESGEIFLPAAHYISDQPDPAPVMSVIYPLEFSGARVGYFSIDAPVGPFNRMAEVASRTRGGKLFIAELNPDNSLRDGLLLFDDVTDVAMNTERDVIVNLQAEYPLIYGQAFHSPSGKVDLPDQQTRVYYQTFFPYPDRLITWVVGTRIDLAEMGAPFRRIRIGIWASLVLTLIISLLLTRWGARQIALPVAELSESISRYARGDRQLRIELKGPEEIRRAGQAFNFMADALDQAENDRDDAKHSAMQSERLASLGRMAAGIGHEINNPLGNILSLIKLIERDIPAEQSQLHSDISAIRSETNRVSRIVKSILNFGRQIAPENEMLDVSGWLSDVCDQARRQLPDRKIDCFNDLQDNLFIEGDRELLNQALINLIVNADHASPEGEAVQLLTDIQDDKIRITVRDNGSGIPADIYGNIFDPFFTTKEAGEGSGLGLSLGLGIVEHHGGSLRLENAQAGGAVAIMSLPYTLDKTSSGHLVDE